MLGAGSSAGSGRSLVATEIGNSVFALSVGKPWGSVSHHKVCHRQMSFGVKRRLP